MQSVLVMTFFILFFFGTVDAKQNLRQTTCPLCDMDIRPEINAPILGNQAIYACEMAGHIDQLHNQPSRHLGAPRKIDITTDSVYKTATEITCPVCGKGFHELKYAVPWISLGNQKIFTCSEDHAQQVLSNPTQFITAAQRTGDFCNKGSSLEPRGSVMFNGFQLAIGTNQTCARLLFQPWVISSSVKYAFAFIGIVFLAMSMEGFGQVREWIETRWYQHYGVVFSAGDREHYVPMQTPNPVRESFKCSSFSNPRPLIVRTIPWRFRILLGGFYMIHLTIAYWLMLIIMMYESLFFIAIIIGLGSGFLLFKDTEVETMSGNVDPCCST